MNTPIDGFMLLAKLEGLQQACAELGDRYGQSLDPFHLGAASAYKTIADRLADILPKPEEDQP